MEHLDSMSHEETNLSAKEDRLLTRMRQQRGRRGGERGEATASQVVPKTKGFPWLKTQLQSLFLAVISQVWWRFAAEAFIPECMRGEQVIKWGRGEEKESEQGSEEECRKCKECAIINATQHVDPFVPKVFEKPWLWFFVPNWLSPFEMEEQAACLTWFRGLSSLKWREASNSFLKRQKSPHFR